MVGKPRLSSITVIEDNQDPTFASSAPATATENTLYVYDVDCDDADIPPDTLTVSVGGSDTCGGSVVDDSSGDGIGQYTFTPGETAAGGAPCLLEVACSDTKTSVTQSRSISFLIRFGSFADQATTSRPRWWASSSVAAERSPT